MSGGGGAPPPSSHITETRIFIECLKSTENQQSLLYYIILYYIVFIILYYIILYYIILYYIILYYIIIYYNVVLLYHNVNGTTIVYAVRRDRYVVMRSIPVFYSPVNPKHIFGTPCSVSVEITYGRHILFLLFFSVCSQLA